MFSITSNRPPALPHSPRLNYRHSCRRFKVQRSSTARHLWHLFSCSLCQQGSVWPRLLTAESPSVTSLRLCFGHQMDSRVYLKHLKNTLIIMLMAWPSLFFWLANFFCHRRNKINNIDLGTFVCVCVRFCLALFFFFFTGTLSVATSYIYHYHI